jgi:hypothetical protein
MSLKEIRRELDRLNEARMLVPLSVSETVRYRELCAVEAELLRNGRAA